MSQIKGSEAARARLAYKKENPQEVRLEASTKPSPGYQAAASHYVGAKQAKKKPSVIFALFRSFLLLTSKEYWALRWHEHLYALRLGAKHLRSAPLANFITVVVLGLVLGLPGFLSLVISHAQTPLLELRDSASLTLYLSPEVTLNQAEKIKSDLAKIPKIKEVKWIDKKTAWEDFKQKSAVTNYGSVVKDNPLPETAVVILQENATRDEIKQLDEKLREIQFVDLVQWETDWILKLNSLVSFSEKLLWIVSLSFGVTVILVVLHTVRWGVLQKAEEIRLIRLVGGANQFIRLPFLYFAGLLGLFAGLFGLLVVHGLCVELDRAVVQINHVFGSSLGKLSLILENMVFLVLAGVILGWVGAWLAVEEYLFKNR